MSPLKKPFRLNAVFLVLILGLIAFVLYIYYFVSPTQIINILSKTNLTIYAGAFITYLLYTIFSSLAWQRLLNNLSVKITKRKAFLYTWVGLFFEATVPQLGWSGEVSKTYLLSKDSNSQAGKIGASVVGQKIFTMTLTIVALSTGLAIVILKYSLPISATLLIGSVLALSIITLGVVYYVSLKPAATKTLINWIIKIALLVRRNWNPQNFKIKAEELLGNFHLGIEQLKRKPKELIQPIIFSVLGFIFEVSVVFLTFAALGQPVPIDVVLIVFTLTGTLQTVGVTIFGFPELIMTLTFTALYIDPAVAVSVALLTRVVNLWFRLIVSYFALQWAGIKIIRQQPKNTKQTLSM
jgi:uncharacterized protein (TIRG00374 family)